MWKIRKLDEQLFDGAMILTAGGRLLTAATAMCRKLGGWRRFRTVCRLAAADNCEGLRQIGCRSEGRELCGISVDRLQIGGWKIGADFGG